MDLSSDLILKPFTKIACGIPSLLSHSKNPFHQLILANTSLLYEVRYVFMVNAPESGLGSLPRVFKISFPNFNLKFQVTFRGFANQIAHSSTHIYPLFNF